MSCFCVYKAQQFRLAAALLCSCVYIVIPALSCHSCAFLSFLHFPVIPALSCHSCTSLSFLHFSVIPAFLCHSCISLSFLRRQESRGILFSFTSKRLKALILLTSSFIFRWYAGILESKPTRAGI